MLGVLEKFIFDNFRGMPKWVRVSTYLLMVLLFSYLLLLPRFIDGQLVGVDSSTNGFVPYRGVELQMQVDGRDYKFKSNQNGYWSVPIVSRLPGPVELQVYHEDKAQWFLVTFAATDVWKGSAHRVEISSSQPFVKLVAASGASDGSLFAFGEKLLGSVISNANAFLVLNAPINVDGGGGALTVSDIKVVENDVTAAMANALGRPVNPDFALKGPAGLTYVQRIQVIQQLEKKYGFSIPDEHWRSMSKGSDLVDYLHKRQLLNQQKPELVKDPKLSWPAIQQSFPPEQRPVFVPR
ncbi:MAG TPA: acyl carrier protein [Burkholderiales bacterium]|nr:acyl carrier protein [Burkholderiales bacterium]